MVAQYLFFDKEIPETLMDCSKFKAGLIYYTNLAGSGLKLILYYSFQMSISSYWGTGNSGTVDLQRCYNMHLGN
jgi:hypothetical protein